MRPSEVFARAPTTALALDAVVVWCRHGSCTVERGASACDKGAIRDARRLLKKLRDYGFVDMIEEVDADFAKPEVLCHYPFLSQHLDECRSEGSCYNVAEDLSRDLRQRLRSARATKEHLARGLGDAADYVASTADHVELRTRRGVLLLDMASFAGDAVTARSEEDAVEFGATTPEALECLESVAHAVAEAAPNLSVSRTLTVPGVALYPPNRWGDGDLDAELKAIKILLWGVAACSEAEAARRAREKAGKADKKVRA